MKPLRLVLTTHQFFPDFSAGTEVLTLSSAKELQARGHQVEVWTGFPAADKHLAEEDRFDAYEFEGISVKRYHHSYTPTSVQRNAVEAEYNNLLFRQNFSEYLRAATPDIVHFFHLSRLSASPIPACQQLQIPTVLTTTDFWAICPLNQLRLPDNSACPGPDRLAGNCLQHVLAIAQPTPMRRLIRALPHWLLTPLMWAAKQTWWLERRFSPMAKALSARPGWLMQTLNTVDRILAPTRFMQEILVGRGLDAARVRRMPYGIDLDLYQNAPANNTRDVIHVGFIGTLAEHKGAHVLIAAARQLPPEMPLAVKIYGGLEEFPQYVAQLKELAGEDQRISFCGAFPNQDIGRVFADLDVLVVPSMWYENTPLVVHSAQATSTPVIGSNVPGISEVIQHGHNGLLFEMGDIEALASLLGRIAGDGEVIRSMSRNASKPTSIPDYIDGLESIYDEILTERSDQI
jgi:glycosyltransferase involved in cell wall biosynthesis